MAPASFHFYERTFTQLNLVLNTYVHGVAGSIVGAISGVAYTLCLIYMMLWGWSMMRGLISEPIIDGVTRLVRLVVVVALAINLGRYESYIANGLFAMPDALAGYVAGGATTGSSVQYLDTLFSQIYNFGNEYRLAAEANSSYGIPDLSMMGMAIILWLVGIVATAFGAFLFALGKMGLSIVLAVGPIFVLLLIFEGTKRFFEAWMGQVLNFVFMVMLSAAGIKMVFTILALYLTASGPITAGNPGFDQAIPAVALSVIGALVLAQVPSIASALGGGVAVSTLGAVGWAYGRTTGSFAAMRPTALRRQVNRLRADGRIVRGLLTDGVGGAAAGRVAGVAGAAAQGAGYAAGRAASAPLAVYRRVTGGRKNRISRA